ncbi:MAG TPA: hypothetical protein EYF94_03490 [Porticoccaceae bacterium]|nr:hypothetical protein [Porticoccaceae bacterium]
MKPRTTLLFVILSLLATPTYPADFKKGVGSGWFLNVHNWTGTSGTATKPGKRFFEDTVADIRRLKKAEFDHMRLHFHIDGLLFWKECKGWQSPDFDATVKCYQRNWAKQKKAKWKTKKKFFTDNTIYLNLFMDALKRITSEGMDVIVVPWGFHGEAGAAYKFTDGALHGDAAFKTLYVKFWSHLTRRIRKEISDWRQIAFQTYNEPFFCDDTKPQVSKWRSVEKRVIRSIRKQIPTSTIFTGAVCTNGDFFFKADSTKQSPRVRIDQVMSPYKQFKNLIYTIHFRQPRVFVFQTFNHPDVKGLKYPMNGANVSSAISKADGSKSDLEVYRDSKWKRTVLFDAIRQAADWKTKHGVRLHITEWGTTRSNVDGKGGGPDARGRLLYTQDMVDAMKKYGITWTHSEWRGWDGLTKKYIYGKDNYNSKNRLLDPAMIKRLKR